MNFISRQLCETFKHLNVLIIICFNEEIKLYILSELMFSSTNRFVLKKKLSHMVKHHPCLTVPTYTYRVI